MKAKSQEALLQRITLRVIAPRSWPSMVAERSPSRAGEAPANPATFVFGDADPAFGGALQGRNGGRVLQDVVVPAAAFSRKAFSEDERPCMQKRSREAMASQAIRSARNAAIRRKVERGLNTWLWKGVRSIVLEVAPGISRVPVRLFIRDTAWLAKQEIRSY